VRLKSYSISARDIDCGVLATVIFDLTMAVQVGIMAACLTFHFRMSSLLRSEHLGAAIHPDLARSSTTKHSSA
jgi:SulP family sulfate permease